MATLNEQLAELQDARDDMQLALLDKGQTVTKDIRTYATAIANISGGGSTTILDVGDNNVSVSGTNLIFTGTLDYTELEYIQSTGTQYINTGIYDNGQLEFEIKGYATNGTSSGSLFGYFGDNASGNKPILNISTYNNQWEFYWNNTLSTNRASCSASGVTELLITFSDNIVNMTNFSKTTTYINQSKTTYTPTASNRPFYLFTRCQDSTTSGGYFRIYYFILKENGVITKYLKPVIKNSTNEIGMLDTITNTFYGNIGTGTFVAGPEKEE